MSLLIDIGRQGMMGGSETGSGYNLYSLLVANVSNVVFHVLNVANNANGSGIIISNSVLNASSTSVTV